MPSTYDPENLFPCLSEDGAASARQAKNLAELAAIHAQRIARNHGERAQTALAAASPALQKIADLAREGKLDKAADEYMRDATQRYWLTLDVLRQRGDNDIAHEAAGTPPVLIYDHEVAMDGKTLPHPCNYVLLKIVPPKGVETHDWKRPYMIIDPRAGHGAGIGGFKSDSQVGVALHDGHPVYFCVFRPQPEPDQTLADVMRAEAEFLREIRRRHPDAPKPVVVGNCQGGWATLILAAANPDISGPLVINGAPVAAWSGRMGENPMRYNGGLLGGALPALLMSDLGAGVFDGAHLVSNFEGLNPGRNYFGKYYDLFAAPEKTRSSFLEFERWWGGFHFMNEAEITWIVRNIFVGNKLSRGEAHLERGRRIDLKAIRSPIIVFASKGDNITPPQQALNWIADTFTDEHEIRVRGHRIIYMVHEKVGHLGIFVSSSIAKKEHAEVTSTLKTIEALAPGLYEMTIDEQIGEGVDAHFRVSFTQRTMSELAGIDDSRGDEAQFGAVSRLSDLACEFYDIFARPFVQTSVSKASAEAARKMHPGRASRRMFSNENPLMDFAREEARRAEKARAPADPANPLLALEKIWANGMVQTLDFWRDMRDAAYEMTFFSIYGAPAMLRFGASHAWARTTVDAKDLAHLPEVEAVLLGIDRGGFAVAVIRMLILIAQARHQVRRDRLERSANVLSHDEPFASLGAEKRAALIREQSIIVEFAPEKAVETLPLLLTDPAERQRAIDVVDSIAGAVEEMEPHTLAMLRRIRSVLGLPRLGALTSGDPLESAQSAAQ
ncbi:alpha/beta fold hydrolase [Rhodoblastus acidophilus]|uniref:Alpha/beta fold hydrolase n=1 Tax=Rhodoblastus acidophilus TaxID=1074 RepID=A0A6N8DNJ4_RHOAC|nr:alpha/beta fold hydrolase [Rhodoblastus acidophilus]MCW2275623.1 pimeloyl-ACP methyl ester carboxylesterase [Rhodoblastus acidophilus]MTV32120.1 alpha/beta fold hydrolase [Rhodoblastus acidophilus]